MEGARDGVQRRVGRLLQARRVRIRLTQGVLAERVGTSQQWVSRVERGEVDLRIGDVERLAAAVGADVVVQLATGVVRDDPDLVAEDRMVDELESFVAGFGVVWRRFEAVPYQVGGRLAALAQGLPAQPLWLDLVVPEDALAAGNQAMAMLNSVRWSDLTQDYTIYSRDLTEPFPRRFHLADGSELRIEVVAALTPAVSVLVDDRTLPVVPLVRLLTEDADIADLAGRCGSTSVQGLGPEAGGT
jgi:transcriptional regulator with XRE-family HTH domain